MPFFAAIRNWRECLERTVKPAGRFAKTDYSPLEVALAEISCRTFNSSVCSGSDGEDYDDEENCF